MSLCVCGHWSQDHQQFDDGEACRDCSCDRYRKAADSESLGLQSTAILSAGGSPEGLARETVAEAVNVVTPPTDEAPPFMDVETYFDEDGHHWVHDPDNCPCGENWPATPSEKGDAL